MSTFTDHGSPASGATLRPDDHPVYDRGDTVCVVGAGASGLAAIKNVGEGAIESTGDGLLLNPSRLSCDLHELRAAIA